MIKRIRAILRRLTEPNENMGLAIAAAIVGILILLWLLEKLGPWFEKLVR